MSYQWVGQQPTGERGLSFSFLQPFQGVGWGFGFFFFFFFVNYYWAGCDCQLLLLLRYG